MSDEAGDENDETVGGEEVDLAERFDFPDGIGGILTDNDRKFLMSIFSRDTKGYDFDGHEAQKRLRIRKKVKTALHDFTYLSDQMVFPDKELDLVLDDILRKDEYEDLDVGNLTETDKEAYQRLNSYVWGDQVEHLVAAMKFLHRAAELAPGLSFEDLIEAAVWENTPQIRGAYPGGGGERARRITVNADVSVDVDWERIYDVEEIEAKLERGEQLTRDEIGELFVQGRIEPGDLGAENVDQSVFQTADFDDSEITTELPGLDPSSPQRSLSDAEKEELREKFPDEMSEKVDWDATNTTVEFLEQLHEHYEDPIGRAMRATDAFAGSSETDDEENTTSPDSEGLQAEDNDESE